MEITSDIIEKAVAGIPFGDVWPFAGGTEEDIEAYFKGVIANLERSGRIKVYRDTDHYGSGFASYVHLFVYERDGRSTHDRGDYLETIGIHVYLSRLSPWAVYGSGSQSKSKDGSGRSSDFIEKSTLYEPPEGDWHDFLRELKWKLMESGVVLPPREQLLAPLPVKVDIPTIWDPPYRVFDALFYWED